MKASKFTNARKALKPGTTSFYDPKHRYFPGQTFIKID